MIRENVQTVLAELAAGNPQGEAVTLVAATKTRTPEEINEAIAAGVTAVGENKVQEFTAKYEAVQGAARHFIGHLQSNKVKYLIGKCDLIDSLDRMELAQELQKRAQNAGLTMNCLLEVNIGCELSKSGFTLQEAQSAYETVEAEFPAIRLRGLMAMLPLSGDEEMLRGLARKMRALYDELRRTRPSVQHLSMGMSGDWRLCVECGSNMVRIGTALFGERHYPAQ